MVPQASDVADHPGMRVGIDNDGTGSRLWGRIIMSDIGFSRVSMVSQTGVSQTSVPPAGHDVGRWAKRVKTSFVNG